MCALLDDVRRTVEKVLPRVGVRAVSDDERADVVQRRGRDFGLRRGQRFVDSGRRRLWDGQVERGLVAHARPFGPAVKGDINVDRRVREDEVLAVLTAIDEPVGLSAADERAALGDASDSREPMSAVARALPAVEERRTELKVGVDELLADRSWVRMPSSDARRKVCRSPAKMAGAAQARTDEASA